MAEMQRRHLDPAARRAHVEEGKRRRAEADRERREVVDQAVAQAGDRSAEAEASEPPR